MGYATQNGYNLLQQDTPLNWADLAVGDILTISVHATRNDLAPATTGIWLNHEDSGSTLQQGWNLDAVTSPGVWTNLVWEYTVTDTDRGTAIANSWGAVNVGVGLTTPASPANYQALFDAVRMIYTPLVPNGTLISIR
jgi:hypothetical protein